MSGERAGEIGEEEVRAEGIRLLGGKAYSLCLFHSYSAEGNRLTRKNADFFFFSPVPLSSGDKSKNKSRGQAVGVEVEMVNTLYCMG